MFEKLQKIKKSWKFVYILGKQCKSHFNLANFFDKLFQNPNFANSKIPNLLGHPVSHSLINWPRCMCTAAIPALSGGCHLAQGKINVLMTICIWSSPPNDHVHESPSKIRWLLVNVASSAAGFFVQSHWSLGPWSTSSSSSSSCDDDLK